MSHHWSVLSDVLHCLGLKTPDQDRKAKTETVTVKVKTRIITLKPKTRPMRWKYCLESRDSQHWLKSTCTILFCFEMMHRQTELRGELNGNWFNHLYLENYPLTASGTSCTRRRVWRNVVFVPAFKHGYDLDTAMWRNCLFTYQTRRVLCPKMR